MHQKVKFVYCIIILLFNIKGNCQNNSAIFLTEVIYPIADTNYNEAKQKLLEYRRHTVLHPSELLFFLHYSLQNKDIYFFKKESKTLILRYGWRYTYSDTLDSELTYQTLVSIKKYGLSDWVVKQSEKLYPRWLKSDFKNTDVQIIVQRLISEDQEDRLLFNYLKSPDSIISTLDLARVFELKELCVRINTFPNDFDNGVGTYYKMQFILAHSLKSKDNFFQSWGLLFPYLEKAYFDHKISGSIFKLYDTFHYRHFGTQYYGTLGREVPVKDEYELNRRKIKYNL